MARPKKDNADYFSHDADMRNDNKIKALRRKYKINGYGIWCMLLEHLTDTNHFKYEYNDFNLELLAGDFDIEPTLLKEIIDYCILLNLIKYEDGYIFSEKLIERFESLLNKRKRDVKPIVKELSTTKTNKKEIIDNENTQSKVKESKVDKINNYIFIEKCLNDEQWVETLSMQNKLKKGDINKKLSIFENHLITKGIQHNNLKEFKNHFVNWINLKPNIDKNNTTFKPTF